MITIFLENPHLFLLVECLLNLRFTAIISVNDRYLLRRNDSPFGKLFTCEYAVVVDLVIVAHARDREQFVEGEENRRTYEEACPILSVM